MPSRSTISSWICAAITLVVASAPASGQETKQERLARLQQMSALQKDRLRRNQERLASLPPEEQERLRNLERQLANDPQGKELREVMLRYHEWLRALPSSERAELRSLVEAERIQKIKSLVAQQETQRLPQLAKESLTPEDVNQVRAWVSDLMIRRKSDLLNELPPHSRQKLADSDDPRQLAFVVMNHLRDRDRGRPSSFMEALRVTEDDRQRLVQKLSAEAQNVYRQTGDDLEKKRTVFQYWFFVAFRPRPPSDAELAEFFERLTSEEQDRLKVLPPEQMKADLIRRYFADRFRRWDRDLHRKGPGADERPGDPLDDRKLRPRPGDPLPERGDQDKQD